MQISKLLSQLSNKGRWQLKKIEDICQIQRGFSFDYKKYKNSGLPIVKVLNVQKEKINTDELVYFSKEDYSQNLDKFLLKPEEVCITVSGASSGKIAFNNHKQDFYISSTVCKFQTNEQVTNKYLYYALLCLLPDIKSLVRGGAVKCLLVKQLQKLEIPVSPLETQNQISEILDTFRELVRELVRELETELELRKQQYEYYSDKLISDVIDKGLGAWKTLGEITTEIYSGNGVTNDQIDSGNYPCTTSGSIVNAFSIWFDKCNFKVDPALIKNPKYFEYGDLLISSNSQTIKKIGICCTYLGREKGIAGNNVVVLKHQQNPKYLAYVLSTYEAKLQKEKYCQQGAVIHLYSSKIKKIKIPLPSLEIQEKIANQLDQFRELVEDLEKGIPKEIEMAKQRYEYFRDLLITGQAKLIYFSSDSLEEK